MIRVRAHAPVHPTEDPAKVRRAVENLFPDARVEARPGEVVAEGGSLAQLAKLVADHQIPDSARGAMLRAQRGARTRFELGKQAAFVGKPHFGAPATALGNVEVAVEADSEEELLRAVYAAAPDTTVAPELARVPREFRPQP